MKVKVKKIEIRKLFDTDKWNWTGDDESFQLEGEVVEENKDFIDDCTCDSCKRWRDKPSLPEPLEMLPIDNVSVYQVMNNQTKAINQIIEFLKNK